MVFAAMFSDLTSFPQESALFSLMFSLELWASRTFTAEEIKGYLSSWDVIEVS
jgi:hypothetical protein